MGRAPCCDEANVKKGPWSPEEDANLKSYIEQHGTGGSWIALPQKIGIRHGAFSDEEDRIICSLFAAFGSRWSIIATYLPGRTDNDIKNYWNTILKKRILAMQLNNIPIIVTSTHDNNQESVDSCTASSQGKKEAGSKSGVAQSSNSIKQPLQDSVFTSFPSSAFSVKQLFNEDDTVVARPHDDDNLTRNNQSSSSNDLLYPHDYVADLISEESSSSTYRSTAANVISVLNSSYTTSTTSTHELSVDMDKCWFFSSR